MPMHFAQSPRAPSCAANHSWCQGDPENLLDIVKGPANQVRALFHLTKLLVHGHLAWPELEVTAPATIPWLLNTNFLWSPGFVSGRY